MTYQPLIANLVNASRAAGWARGKSLDDTADNRAEDAALDAIKAEIERLRAALTEVVGCFDAAEFEGLSNHLINETMEPGSLTDLVYRRLLPALAAARGALDADEQRLSE